MTFLRILLACALAFLSPLQAFAAVMQTAPVRAAPLVQAALPLTLPAGSMAGGMSLASPLAISLTSSLLPSARPTPSVAASPLMRAEPVRALAPVARAGEAAPAAKPVLNRDPASERREEAGVQDGLKAVVEELHREKGGPSQSSRLGEFFNGTRRAAMLPDAVEPVETDLAEVSGRAPGLRPASFSEGRAAAAVPAKPAGDFSPEVKRALLGMFVSRVFSMIAFSIASIAYPLMVMEVAGQAQMFNLYSLGGIISIGIALLAGKTADHMPLKKYALANVALRGVLGLANAALYSMGLLNFWTLLGLSVVNAWQFSTLFVTDPAIMTALVGKDRSKIRSAESLLRIATILVAVGSGLFLGAAVVKALGLAATFTVVSVLFAVPVAILWWTLPDVKHPGERQGGISELAGKLRAFAWKKYALKAAIIGAGFIGALVWQSPLPVIAVLLPILLRSAMVRETLGKHPLLKMALVFVMITTVAETPLRNAVLGALAQATVGAGEKASYLGQLLASYYMGQLPTGTGQLDAGLHVRVGGREFDLKSVLKWVGAAAFAAWVSLMLLPASWSFGGLGTVLAAGASALFYHWVHKFTPKVTEHGWMRLEVVGLLGMSLPLFFWGSPVAFFVSLFLFGLVHSPNMNLMHASYASQVMEHASGSFQYLMGVKGSFLNMANSIAYAVYGLAMTLPAEWWGAAAFPFTWWVAVAMYALMAVIFLIGSFKMPFKPAHRA
ncbi:MAG: hypothetical protein WC728_05665 [Elusimicrobiota bacterium]